MKKRMIVTFVLAFIILPSILAIEVSLKKGDTNQFGIPGLHKTSHENVNSFQSNFATTSTNIEVLWPLEGFYYITDALQLAIKTDAIAHCQYNFENLGFKDMEVTDDFTHSHYIYDLQDNMNGEAYEIIFKCIDESQSESTTSTFFWINTTDVNKYFVRNDIEKWSYQFSTWWMEENISRGMASSYYAIYEHQNNPDLHSGLSIFIFNDRSSLEKFMHDEFFSNFYNISVEVLDNQNIYVFDSNMTKNAAWTHDNYFINSYTYHFKNDIPTNPGILAHEVIDSYLQKYPSDLRYGICGDGTVNIFNQAGMFEECDGNKETKSCGSVGECKGEIERSCTSDCTWADWGICNAKDPTNEICDGKDNDCNGVVDQENICKQNFLTITSPNSFYYSDKKIYFNITSSEQVDKITYVDNAEKRSREKVLCKKNCYGYGNDKRKSISFQEGYHNLTLRAIKNNFIVGEKNITFFIDDTLPKISKIEPKKIVSNNFSVEFSEDNPKSIGLFYGNVNVDLSFDIDCTLVKRKYKCRKVVDLSSFKGQKINFWFEIIDIVGNKGISKKNKVKVI
ncbi:MAG: putative metal-binding motif-containing protein [Nanoarchaeota archaeon]